jgi:EAL domain-containing protein (putative c-di-GMP-specific phosphodiesterase class I)
MLRAHNCTELQGYLLGKPMPAGAVEAFLEVLYPTQRAEGAAEAGRELQLAS